MLGTIISALLGGGGGFLGGEVVQSLMGGGGGGMLNTLAGPIGGLLPIGWWFGCWCRCRWYCASDRWYDRRLTATRHCCPQPVLKAV